MACDISALAPGGRGKVHLRESGLMFPEDTALLPSPGALSVSPVTARRLPRADPSGSGAQEGAVWSALGSLDEKSRRGVSQRWEGTAWRPDPPSPLCRFVPHPPHCLFGGRGAGRVEVVGAASRMSFLSTCSPGPVSWCLLRTGQRWLKIWQPRWAVRLLPAERRAGTHAPAISGFLGGSIC